MPKRKAHRFNFMCSHQEWDRLTAIADLLGVSRGDWLRMKINQAFNHPSMQQALTLQKNGGDPFSPLSLVDEDT